MHGNHIPTMDDLWQLIQEQQEQNRRQQEAIARLERQVQGAEPADTTSGMRRHSRWNRVLSRGQLFKAGAMGLVGLAGTEVAGALQEQPAYASTTNYEAAGGTGIAFYQPGDSTGYGYNEGAYLYGQSYGVHAEAKDASGNLNDGVGVFGESGSGPGLYGESVTGYGVFGYSAQAAGIIASGAIGVVGQVFSFVPPPSGTSVGVYGSGVYQGKVGVFGTSDTNNGVEGTSTSGAGVRGISSSSIGVYGTSTSNIGVFGGSTNSVGVQGRSTSSFGGLFSSTQGTGVLVQQITTLTANTNSPCLSVDRTGTNSSGNAYNYSGALIYGNDSPSNSGGGSTPASTGPLLQLAKNGTTQCKVDGSGNLMLAGGLAVNGASATGRPTITGSKGGNAALASLLAALAAMGLITDSTT